MEEMGYQIASRATILLGREGVSRSDGAVIELIKNSYDADANFCFIYFDRAHDRILIIDDGTGMTQKIIASAWMTIGTDNKKEEYVSRKKRIKSGEKGIGRFALDRLGRVCRMYTKHADERLIHWEMDWGLFEKSGQTLSEVKARFEHLDGDFVSVCNKYIRDFPKEICKVLRGRTVTLKTGTLLEISQLRDDWSAGNIDHVCEGLESLLPPQEQGVYDILIKRNEKSAIVRIEGSIQDEYDYRLLSEFDGNRFNIKLYRNELNVDGIPQMFFKREFFSRAPFRLRDFMRPPIEFTETIPSLLETDNEEQIENVAQIGRFTFDFRFLKLSDNEKEGCRGFHKKISVNRKTWMEQFAGIKIYRDNFSVRPYGDKTSNSFDWLGLDARKNLNPVAVSHKSLQWHVRHSQVQGALFISRVDNPGIADKSSREGLIENSQFKNLCLVLKALISVFERDRAKVEREIRIYSDEMNEAERVKREAEELARKELSERLRGENDGQGSEKDAKTKQKIYAKAINYYREEINELASEIKLLRSLATNGLITSSLVHDLKSINGMLVVRAKNMREAFQNDSQEMALRQLDDLNRDDEFLKSWITVITSQSYADKRTRTNVDLGAVIRCSIKLLEPILQRKKVRVKINVKDGIYKRIFKIDFESLIYNLLINSVEAFEGAKRHLAKREVCVGLFLKQKQIIIEYKDSGPGLAMAFKEDPEKILRYGVTSKVGKNGEKIGTGLGMYIVSMNVNEYKGKIDLTQPRSGFAIKIMIPED